MIVAIVQGSTQAPDADVQKAIPALQRQVNEHLAPAWQVRADLVYVARGAAPPTGAWVIQLLDVCDDKGADGYHEFDGKPSGVVGVKTSIDDGCSWTSTLSHEVLELIVDPWAVICIQAADKVYSLEVCDPVEGQAYQIDGVELSDFVLPTYYRPNSAGPWNYNAAAPLKGPLTLAKGGYNSAAGVGDWKQSDAALVRLSKRSVSPRSRRGRRMAALHR